MKLLVLVLSCATAAIAADCLRIDSAIMKKAPCASGTCAVAYATQDTMVRLVAPQFQVIGHNACTKERTGAGADGISTVTFAFYDAKGYRVGLANALIAPLAPGEKFRHVYLVPDEVSASGSVAKITVAKVDDTAK